MNYAEKNKQLPPPLREKVKNLRRIYYGQSEISPFPVSLPARSLENSAHATLAR